MSPLMSPFQPRRMPITSMPRWSAERTTLRTAAFMPGASPPLVKTPILRMVFFVSAMKLT